MRGCGWNQECPTVKIKAFGVYGATSDTLYCRLFISSYLEHVDQGYYEKVLSHRSPPARIPGLPIAMSFVQSGHSPTANIGTYNEVHGDQNNAYHITGAVDHHSASQFANPLTKVHRIVHQLVGDVDTVTYADVPQLVYTLTVADDVGEHSRVSAAIRLIRIATTISGLDHIIIAVLDANVLPQLVNHLSDPGPLMQHVACILACILQSPHTWHAALSAHAIPFLVARLSDSDFGTQVSVVSALASITNVDSGKREAASAGAMPLLVASLCHPSHALTKIAARAVRNIASIKAGRKAAYISNAIQPLVLLLTSHPLDFEVEYDAAKTLAWIASLNKTARKTMRAHGAVAKLKALSRLNPPVELQVVLRQLRDELRVSYWLYCCGRIFSELFVALGET